MKFSNTIRSVLGTAILGASLALGTTAVAQTKWLDFPDIAKTGEILSNALRIPGLDGVGGLADGGFHDSGRVNVEPVGLNQERAAPGHGEPIPNGQAFQITVDGQAIDGNGAPTQLLVPTAEDDQRAVDVALDAMDINLSYDGLELKRVANVEAQARSLEAGVRWRPVVFTPYWNYGAWIRRAEVRIFPVDSGVAQHRSGASTQKKPLEVLPVTAGKRVDWIPSRDFGERYPEVQYVLRMYGRDGRFDETRPKRLKITKGQLGRFDNDVSAFDVETLIGYDKNSLEIENIEVSGGAVTVSGRDVPEGFHIFVMGREVPVSRGREFVLREIVPAGSHNVTIAILDRDGKGIEFQRNLYVPDNDFFYIGLGDLTIGTTDVSGPASTVLDAEGEYDDVYIDGRLAFFLKGKVQGKYLITAMADTGEDSIGDLLSNLDEKDTRQLLRRLDPDRYYPVYGDDSTTEELAPTQGKFFVRVERGNSYVMWGNYQTELTQTDFAQVSRGLYGLKAHYGSPTQTSFGEQRIQVDAFAAEPGTAHQREVFRGTGGSVYFLQKQDISIGGERLRIEVRDSNSNIVLNSRNLVYGEDYDIDYIQGRIILSQPLTSTVDDGFLVQGGTLSGNPAFLVAYLL